MKIILTADVPNLGAPGDIVEVKDGYGRNYLLPRKMAIVATRGAEKQVDTIRRAQRARQIRDLDHAKEVAGELGKLTFTVRNIGTTALRATTATVTTSSPIGYTASELT